MATNNTGSTKSVARKQAKTTAKGQATKTRNQASKTASTAKTSAKSSAKRTASTTRSTTSRTATEANRTAGQAKGGVNAVGEYVLQAAGTAVDVPVGAALTAVDRVTDLNDRFSTQHKREVEVRRVRNQLRRELNRVERRGGTARRKALQQAKRTRNRVEREVKQRRRATETQLKRNRTEAEKRVKVVSERVQSLV